MIKIGQVPPPPPPPLHTLFSHFFSRFLAPPPRYLSLFLFVSTVRQVFKQVASEYKVKKADREAEKARGGDKQGSQRGCK
jgi:hypothetical protein